jgi:hypothetical protein
MTEKQLLARDAKRDIGAELLLSVRQMRADNGNVVVGIGRQPQVLKLVFKKLPFM